MKHCPRCQRTLPLDRFYRKGTGHQHVCISCKRGIQKAWYEKNKTTHLKNTAERKREIRDTNRDYIRTVKQSSPCPCGESHIACLDFHHRDPKEKLFSIGQSIAAVSLDVMKAEIAKCDVICSNCHRKKHADRYIT